MSGVPAPNADAISRPLGRGSAPSATCRPAPGLIRGVLTLLALSPVGCFLGLPMGEAELADPVAEAGPASKLVVVLDNATGQTAAWDIVWETKPGNRLFRRRVTTEKGTLTPIVLPGSARRVALGSLEGGGIGATLMGRQQIAVPYAGRVIVPGQDVFEGDVVRFNLTETAVGPTLQVVVTPAG